MKDKNQKMKEEKRKKEDAILKKNNKKFDLEQFQTQQKNFEEYEKKKEEKIKKIKQEQIKKEQAKLVVNKKPKVSKKELDNTLNRLYKADIKKRKEKQQMLKNLFVPSFKPKTNFNKEINKTIDRENEEKNNDDSEIIMDEKIVLETQKVMTNKTQEKIENALRNRLFIKKKFIFKNKL